MKPPYRKSWAGKSNVVRFDLEPLLQGQTRTAKLKRVYNSFIIDPRGLQCEANLPYIVGWEYSDARFDLWPLLQGQTMVRWFHFVFPVDTDLHRFCDV